MCTSDISIRRMVPLLCNEWTCSFHLSVYYLTHYSVRRVDLDLLYLLLVVNMYGPNSVSLFTYLYSFVVFSWHSLCFFVTKHNQYISWENTSSDLFSTHLESCYTNSSNRDAGERLPRPKSVYLHHQWMRIEMNILGGS